MSVREVYYTLKPLLPVRLLMALRCYFLKSKMARCADIWPIDVRAGNKPDGWEGWPEGKKFALVLTHDVETAKGVAKCPDLMELDAKCGFRSSFNFVPERYEVPGELRHTLTARGFEVGVHGLKHDGKLYKSRKIFKQRAIRINHYLKEWNAVGFRSPAMHHNLEWIHDLNILYDASTFDTDPFEPQPDGVGTIFPFSVSLVPSRKSYVELPYSLPQDSTLFLFMKQRNIDLWIRKLDWVVEHGGMALVITHPDYMKFRGENRGLAEYPAQLYEDLLRYVQSKYEDQYWHVLPREMASFWQKLQM